MADFIALLLMLIILASLIWLIYDICIKHKFKFGEVISPIDSEFIKEEIRNRLKTS